MRKTLSLLMAVLVVISLVACAQPADSTPGITTDAAEAETAAPTNGETQAGVASGFRVEGTRLLDANGNEFVMRGVNHPHNWYGSQDGVALTAIAATGSNTVRIVCGAGIIYSKDTVSRLNRVINLCKTLKMVVVLEVHDITGKNDLKSLEKVVDYWIEVKDALIGNEAYVILNIANEWLGGWNNSRWQEGYTDAVIRLRQAGIKNCIMVDAGGWGQHAQSISDSGQAVLEADPDQNVMFSIHMYGSAGKNAATIEKNLSNVTGKDLCVIVGEFGYKHGDGDVDEAFILEYCDTNDIGYLGWSWKGNSGGVEYLDIAEEWDGSVLSADWGEFLINSEHGIKATSTLCSIYT